MKTLLRATLPLLLLSVCSMAGLKAQDLSGLWVGYYEGDPGARDAKVECAMMLVQDDKLLRAKLVEKQSFGSESKVGLAATVQGTVEDKKASLVKTYDGSGEQSHSVAYALTLSEDGKSLTGTWSVNGLTGKAVFKRLDAAEIEKMK